MVMLGIIHTCTALQYKPAFIAVECSTSRLYAVECLTATQEILVRSSSGTKGV